MPLLLVVVALVANPCDVPHRLVPPFRAETVLPTAQWQICAGASHEEPSELGGVGRFVGAQMLIRFQVLAPALPDDVHDRLLIFVLFSVATTTGQHCCVDVGQDAAAENMTRAEVELGELLVVGDGEADVPWGDDASAVVPGGVAGELEDLGRHALHHCSEVDVRGEAAFFCPAIELAGPEHRRKDRRDQLGPELQPRPDPSGAGRAFLPGLPSRMVVLGDGLDALGDGVLPELAREQQPGRGLDVTRRDPLHLKLLHGLAGAPRALRRLGRRRGGRRRLVGARLALPGFDEAGVLLVRRQVRREDPHHKVIIGRHDVALGEPGDRALAGDPQDFGVLSAHDLVASRGRPRELGLCHEPREEVMCGRGHVMMTMGGGHGTNNGARTRSAQPASTGQLRASSDHRVLQPIRSTT